MNDRAVMLTRLVVIGVVVALLAGAWPRVGVVPARAQGQAVGVGQVYAEAQSAISAREYRAADRLLRTVLSHEPDHKPAAQALRELYRRGSVRVEVDEAAVGEVMELLGPTFRRTMTDHFVILSDCDRAWTQGKSRLLERAYDQVARMMVRMGMEPVPPPHKLLCVLIEDHDMYRSFARTHDSIEAPWVAGYYASLTNRVVFYNDLTGPAFRRAIEQLDAYEVSIVEVEERARGARRSRDMEEHRRLDGHARQMRAHLAEERRRLEGEAASASAAKTIHEATHLIAFNCGLQTRYHQFPFWLTEGLATAFEADDASGILGPDRPSTAREGEFRRYLQGDELLPLGLMVQLNTVPGDENGTAEVMYAQSYALFRFLYRYERAQLAGLFRDIAAEPPGAIRPKRQLELFTARFGDPDRLERRWLRSERSSVLSDAGSARSEP